MACMRQATASRHPTSITLLTLPLRGRAGSVRVNLIAKRRPLNVFLEIGMTSSIVISLAAEK